MKIPKEIKEKFKADVFTPLIEEDIKKYGKPKHKLHECYIAIEWMLRNGFSQK